MATSTTTRVSSREIRELLQAYNVHHSGSDEQREQPERRGVQVPAQLNPVENRNSTDVQPSVPQGHQNDIASRRRVPPYRQTHRDHTLASRPAGLNLVSAAFTQTVFIGVYITGVRHKSRKPLFFAEARRPRNVLIGDSVGDESIVAQNRRPNQ